MKRTLALGLMAMSFAACSDSTGSVPAEFAGTWTASEFSATNANDPTQTFNFVDQDGSFSVTLRADGTFTQTQVVPGGGGTETDSGTYSVSGSKLTFTDTSEDDDTETTFVRNGDTMTVTWTANDFDWDGDGDEDPTNFRIVLNRS